MAFSLAGFAQGLDPSLQAMAQQYLQHRQQQNTATGLMNYLQQQQQDSSDGSSPPPQIALPPPAQISADFGGGGGGDGGGGGISALPGSMPLPNGVSPPAQSSLMPSVMPTATNVTSGGAAPINPTPVGGGGAGAPPVAAPPPAAAAGGMSPIAAAAQGAMGPPPQAMPGGPTSGPTLRSVGAAAADPLSGAAQGTQDPMKRLQQNLGSLINGLRKANPRANPLQILQMAEQYTGMIKGIDDSDKQLMREQLAIAKQQTEFQMRLLGIQAKHEDVATQQEGATERTETTQAGAMQRAELAHQDRLAAIDNRWRIAKNSTDSQERRTAAQDAVRLQVAEIAQAGANKRTDEVVRQRQIASENGINLKVWDTVVQTQLKEEGFSDNEIGRIFSAQQQASPDLLTPPGMAPHVDLGTRPTVQTLGGGEGGGDAVTPVTPTATSPPVRRTQAPSGQPPPAALALLKEGVPQHFANGQVWTKKNGKPVRLK